MTKKLKMYKETKESYENEVRELAIKFAQDLLEVEYVRDEDNNVATFYAGKISDALGIFNDYNVTIAQLNDSIQKEELKESS